ncbi:alpha-amylase [Tersicoccus phoenicis]|uniref:Alpha-amylase n=1 Tax=Tersicoccus phoenicis TaxID=554083 RepID=A0A1R1L7W0_9MICC|nr:glycoside hydrolase family 13 protein [Tersicoccus phoenicis]OMH23625.1 alpha-amylase [Tersicoccus phoenicis]
MTLEPAPADTRTAPWWADAVIYQVYPRSFADADGDGMGDLPGITARLDHLARLGVDALWLSPFYLSPQHDAGYDVADYRQVDPRFGTLADFDALREKADALGIRTIVDLVPNHTSSEHVWFQQALASAPGSPERDRYLFRDGRGPDGAEPPNNWTSVFGGPGWTRVPDGQWYLHLFDVTQPDLNWHNREVVAEFDDVLRFWLDRGVAGFRVDVAHGLVKHPDLPDWDGHTAMVEGTTRADGADPIEEHVPAPMFDQDGVHEIYRHWNEVLAEYDGDRMMVAEAWVEPAPRLAKYVRPDEMQQAFNFEFLIEGWDAAGMARAVENVMSANEAVGAPTTWVLSNHDVVRHASRFGLADPTHRPPGIGPDDEQPDAGVGLRRARAATLAMLALPGSAYLYQGEELGLPEATQLPAEVRQDPTFVRSGGAELGRDGCRVPLPWQAGAPAYGFSPTGASWLPQPAAFADHAVDVQEGVPGSTLELYRQLTALRRQLRLGTGTMAWADVHAPDEGVLAFTTEGVLVVLNASGRSFELPAGAELLLASVPDAVDGGALAPDTAVWLRLP